MGADGRGRLRRPAQVKFMCGKHWDIFAMHILLIVSLYVFRLSDARSFGVLNLTQAVRTDRYAKMEMLVWICDIYR